jgi:hypothetical protein
MNVSAFETSPAHLRAAALDCDGDVSRLPTGGFA